MASNVRELRFTRVAADTAETDGQPNHRGEVFHFLEEFFPTLRAAGQTERLLRLLGLHFDDAHQLIKNLPKFAVDVDAADVDFLPTLATNVGAEFNFDIPFLQQREEIKQTVPSLKRKGTEPGLEAKVESIAARDVDIIEFVDHPLLSNLIGQDPVFDEFTLVTATTPDTLVRLEQTTVTQGVTFEVVDGGAPAVATLTVTGTGTGPFTLSVEVDLGTTLAVAVADAINAHVIASQLITASISAGDPFATIDATVASTALSSALDQLDRENHLQPDLLDLDVIKLWLGTWGFENELVHRQLSLDPVSFLSFDRLGVVINLADLPEPSPAVAGFETHQTLLDNIVRKLTRILPKNVPFDTTPKLLVRTPIGLEEIPHTDFDVSDDTVLPVTLLFEDDFLFGFSPPPSALSVFLGGGGGGPAGPPAGHPLLGGPISVTPTPLGVMASWENPTGHGSMGSDEITPFGPVFGVEVIAPPPADTVDAYVCSTPCNTLEQYVALKFVVVPGSPTGDHTSMLAVCRYDDTAAVGYYLAVNVVALTTFANVEWRVGFFSGDTPTDLTAPAAFEGLSTAVVPVDGAFTIRLEVTDDGGTGADLRVVAFDHGTSSLIDVTTNDAVPADAGLLTGAKVGLGNLPVTGSSLPGKIAATWRGGDL